MKKCANCNKEYEDSKLFCPVCGGALTAIDSSGVNSAATSDIGNVLQPGYQQPVGQQPQNLGNNNSADNNDISSKCKVWQILAGIWAGVYFLLILAFGIGLTDLVVMVLAAVAVAYFEKTKKAISTMALSTEECEKVMRKGKIALLLSVIIFILSYIIVAIILSY